GLSGQGRGKIGHHGSSRTDHGAGRARGGTGGMGYHPQSAPQRGTSPAGELSLAEPIQFNRDFDPAYGQAIDVSPLIRRVVAHNPGPFTFTGTGTYIVGHGTVAVIDPGPDLPDHLDALL